MSLDPHKDGRANRVPAVHFGNTFHDSILVFFTDETVVLDVVDAFEVPQSPEGVD